MLRSEISRLSAGRDIDFTRGWWTPPLGVQEATQLEANQIGDLGLQPFVSLTDHDNFDAHQGSHTAAVELTVKLGHSFVHLGIHNLPEANRSNEVLRLADDPAALMDWLAQFPDALLVLNHPLWDEAGIGRAAHLSMIEGFLARFAGHIHALELNGLRPWTENSEVIELSKAWQLPYISGGDRHGFEPNANINLPNAGSLTEFVHEVRDEGRSDVLFLRQYRKPFQLRIATNLLEILDDHPAHALGWTRWSDRTFYEMQPGQIRSLAEYWPQGEPTVIRFFIAIVGMMRSTLPRDGPSPSVTGMFIGFAAEVAIGCLGTEV